MPDPTALTVVLCLGAALGCLALALARVGDRPTQLTHALMGVAMAGMASPWGNPLPAWTGVVGFAVLGTWFATAGRTARHLAISSAAMVLMYLRPGPHAGHGGAGLAVTSLALALAGYFAWHTWTCVDRARARPAARLEPVAHGVMSALMASMFLGAV